MKNKNIQLKELDFFRTIATLLIFFYHSGVLLPVRGAFAFRIDIINNILSTGRVGVDLFFVLSGFLLAYTSYEKWKNGEVGYIKYLKKRFIRIAPSYYFVILMTLVFQPIFLTSFDGILNLLSHLTFTHTLFIDYFGSIVGVAWTLGIEMNFYIIFPLVYFIIFNRFKSIKFAVLGLFITVLFSWIYRYLLFKYIYPDWDFTQRFTYTNQLPGLIDQFGIGIFCSFIYIKYIKDIKVTTLKTIFSTVFLGALVVAYLFWVDYDARVNGQTYSNLYHTLFLRTLIAAIFGMMILSSFLIWEPLKKILFNKIVLIISKLSYSIFLWHLIIMTYFMNVQMSLLPKLIIVIILTAVVSFAAYHLIEKPFLQHKK